MKSIESQANENKQSLNQWREVVESVAAFATGSGGVINIEISPKGEPRGVEIGRGALEDLANNPLCVGQSVKIMHASARIMHASARIMHASARMGKLGVAESRGVYTLDRVSNQSAVNKIPCYKHGKA